MRSGTSLEEATIHGVRYARIFIPWMIGPKKLYAHNDRFKSTEEVPVIKTLETLEYISQTKGITSGVRRNTTDGIQRFESICRKIEPVGKTEECHIDIAVLHATIGNWNNVNKKTFHCILLW